MPTQEINASIAALETQLRHHENLLEHSIANNEILAKTKIILRKLREISLELNELKKIKAENN
jgi:hypothetical protein